MEERKEKMLRTALMIAKGHGWDIEALFDRLETGEKDNAAFPVSTLNDIQSKKGLQRPHKRS